MPRERMTIATELAEVEAAFVELQAAEAALVAARERLRLALSAASAAGASYGFLGRMVNLSRQRVAELVHEARASA